VCDGWSLLVAYVDQAAVYYSQQNSQQQRQQHHAQQQPVPGSTAKERKLSWKAEIRAAKWFCLVLSVFAVCWLPLHFMNTVSLLAGRANLIAVNIAVILSHANSAVNPVLYAYSNAKLAAAFRRILRLPQRFTSEPTDVENTDTLGVSAWWASVSLTARDECLVKAVHDALVHVGSIDVVVQVALRWIRLLLGWVTEQINHLDVTKIVGLYHSNQLTPSVLSFRFDSHWLAVF